MSTTKSKLLSILRWSARILSLPIFLIMMILFLEDGAPMYLFLSDPIHMTALSIMLLGLLAGWIKDGIAAIMILTGFFTDWLLLSISFGGVALNMGPIVPFFLLIGLIYLFCWWRNPRALSGN